MSEEKKESKRERILGIDLGTTNSAAAIMEAGRPVTIPSAEGQTLAGKMFPSVVAFTKEGQLLVGEPAKRQAVTNPEGTIFEIKRKMGTDLQVNIHRKEYTPQQISAFILQKIKRDAETYLGEKLKKCVITVPAHFDKALTYYVVAQALKKGGYFIGNSTMYEKMYLSELDRYKGDLKEE